MTEEINLKNIFTVFFKIGVILLGGGYVIIPIMKTELVEKRNWINENELTDFYCMSQCLPGIIAVNMSILTGYKLLNFKGALVSLFAMCLSPFVSIILIAGILDKIMQIPFIQSVFWGINLSVIILIYLTLKEMWQKSIKDIFCFLWFVLILTLSVLKVSPVVLLLSSVVFGVVIQIFKKIKGEKNV